mmetsp:Transcript_14175/g.20943  ORF Transcript_14175/g.20943 Transcript_14175/m.20943 type:complete len:516 (-) Transcript_14175:140-1687(-)
MSSTSNTPTPDTQPPNDDWRSSVPQSHRSAEVRQIAKVLASLEPGATAGSKLMLAMRFEDQIFSAAISLADYRKKLTKRLKRLQKNYKPTPVRKDVDDDEQIILSLRRKYGDALTFISEHASKAVIAMREKSGSERAKHLEQHTENARSWAFQLGLGPGSDPKKIPKIEKAELDRVKKHLEQRVENIRSHVVKLTKPDLFLEERLVDLEQSFKPKPSCLLASSITKRFDSLGWKEFENLPEALRHSFEKAFQHIPPPSRDPRSKNKTALAYLEAMRASSQAYLAYMATVNKDSADIPKNALSKSHSVVCEGLTFLEEEILSTASKSNIALKVTLEDAWTKIMETPVQDDADDTLTIQADSDSHSSTAKRLTPTVIKSRVLLTTGRICPKNLLPALERKGAKLVHPSGGGAFLLLDFDAFLLTVYLVPLVVTIRPKDTTGPVSVWGAEGTWETLGHIVQDRLDHAAAHVTQILRTFFAKIRARSDFEVEIAEGTALLAFLQLARTTYMPGWQDIEI